MISIFNASNFHQLCDKLALKNPILKSILDRYGYPPLWGREPDFQTLIHIILEQQVSLASAKSALNKLVERVGPVTPQKLLSLADEELKACYFSRQKTGYAKHLAISVLEGQLVLEALNGMDDEEVRHELKKIKGIGDWTADVFLMMALHRCDLFPTGDIALVNSVRFEMNAPHLSKDDILLQSQQWKPYRTIAAFLFWHAYIQRKGIVIPP
ncbi:MAG: DNA-3-methyladenine glycosylase 2 family protein [Bacteroidota bacterium]